jgi:hypothetical protein
MHCARTEPVGAARSGNLRHSVARPARDPEGVLIFRWGSPVLDILVQRRRDTRAALRLMRKLLKKQGLAPKLLVTTSCALTPPRSGVCG